MNGNELSNITRRHFFAEAFGKTLGIGIGSAALSTLLSENGLAQLGTRPTSLGVHPFDFAPKAKSIIYLEMAGGVPHVDMFDFKPTLAKHDQEPVPDSLINGERFAFIRGKPKLQKSPWEFKQYGQSGAWLSSLLPYTAKVVDDIAIVRSMYTTQFNHGPAQVFQFTGHQIPGRPSLGSWLSYGIGSENKDLPAFVVIFANGSNPDGGSALWSSGFCPSVHQGVALQRRGEPIKFLTNPKGVAAQTRRTSLDLVSELNEEHNQTAKDPEIDTMISQYELAYRMQTSVPSLVDLAGEPEHIQKLYGTTSGQPTFANACILGRRMVERGVRFVQIFQRTWDMHADVIHGAPRSCAQVDQASAALIQDLKQRGLLDSTLVVWASEFGRTPMAQPGKYWGRDHHPKGYTIWLAGGGIKPGVVHGQTDEFGYNAVEDRVSVHDINATILHLLGIEHTKLTYKFAGRNFRLTDVEGEVVKALLA
jgi:Protein of unknown function (DUF1501)